MYTLYYGKLPNGRWKVGCDEAYPNRPIQQEMTEYRDLETHEDIYIASDRELQLQREYGVDVDSIPYYMTKVNASKAARVNVESGQFLRFCAKGGKASRKLNFEIAEEIRELYSKGNTSYTRLATLYDCSKDMIARIIRNETYIVA